MAQFGSYQNEIYGLGLRGVLPTVPVDYATLVKRATAAMPDHVLNYVQGGCGDYVVIGQPRTAEHDSQNAPEDTLASAPPSRHGPRLTPARRPWPWTALRPRRTSCAPS